MNRRIVLSLLFLFIASTACSDTLILKTGKKVEGTIVKEATHYLMFKEKVSAQVKGFLLENIESIFKEEDINVLKKNESKIKKQNVSTANTSLDIDKSSQSPLKDKVLEISESNLLRIYGTDILNENDPNLGDDQSSQDVVFYVKKDKDSLQDTIEAWVEENMQSPSFLTGVIAAIFLLYIFACFPLYLIAKKTCTPNPNLAWLPVFSLYLLCKIAGRPGWWLILLFVPFVNIVIIGILFMGISAACGKSSWLGLLIFFPIVSFFMQWYFALCKIGQVKANEKKQVPMIDEEKEKDSKEQELFDTIVPTKKVDKPNRF